MRGSTTGAVTSALASVVDLPGSFSLQDKTLHKGNVKLILHTALPKTSPSLILPRWLCVLFDSSGHAYS